MNQRRPTTDRRSFLTLVTAAVGTAGLAGCTDDDEGEPADENGEDDGLDDPEDHDEAAGDDPDTTDRDEEAGDTVDEENESA